MRKVKCMICKKQREIDKAFKLVYTTSGGKTSNRYYCSEEEYLNHENEKICRNKFELKMDELFGYPVINNYKRTIYNTILKGGYTNQEMYDCLLDKFSDIESALGYRQDIDEETFKIRYIYAIIKNSIRDVTYKNRKIIELNNKTQDIQYEEYEEEVKVNTNKKKNKTGLFDIIGRI